MTNNAKLSNQHRTVASSEERPRDKVGNRCYHCHGTGHFQKNSLMRGRAAPEESRGRNSGAAPKRVAALVATDELDNNRDRKEKQQSGRSLPGLAGS